MKVSEMTQDTLNTELRRACMMGILEKVKEYFEKGADVNATNKDGWTPLHCASWHGLTEIVKMLVEKGANPKAENKWGYTPLNYAEMKGHKDIIELLEQAIMEAA